jgi:large subunit ribosomal protein L13
MSLNRNNKTLLLSKKKDSDMRWIILDAAGKTLGRFASEVAKILRGKHKPTFTTFEDMGDGVIVINAEKIQVTGNKAATKLYRHYTGHINGLREIPYRVMMARKPQRIIERAVEGMMPRTRLAEAQLKKLRVVAGSEHNLKAQKPIQANI